MSLREELQKEIRVRVGSTELGDEALRGAPNGTKAWGSSQAISNVLAAYCVALEVALLRLADQVDDLRLGRTEVET